LSILKIGSAISHIHDCLLSIHKAWHERQNTAATEVELKFTLFLSCPSQFQRCLYRRSNTRWLLLC
jgi:hypothetical protein